MAIDELRSRIADFLNFAVQNDSVSYETLSVVEENGFERLRIRYSSQDGDQISAFLLVPKHQGRFPGIVVHHQHHGQRHIGKSEICGLIGDPLQAFGPALVQQGFIVLAPDSICFEDRRRNREGTDPSGQEDLDQHYDEMCYRLVRGDTLMRKILSDSAQAISLLYSHPRIDTGKIGLLGHSYGGNTVLFHGALDTRVQFSCASGAACSYEYKLENDVGIEMAEVIPGFASHFDIQDLVACFAPRKVMLVSASEDKYSMDAEQIITLARETCEQNNVSDHSEHIRYDGMHALTQDRFGKIVEWLVRCVD